MARQRQPRPLTRGEAWCRDARQMFEAARAEYRASRCEIDPRFDPHSGLDGDPGIDTVTYEYRRGHWYRITLSDGDPYTVRANTASEAYDLVVRAVSRTGRLSGAWVERLGEGVEGQ